MDPPAVVLLTCLTLTLTLFSVLYSYTVFSNPINLSPLHLDLRADPYLISLHILT